MNIEEGKKKIVSDLLTQERTVCPCCDQSVGRYRRRLSKGQIYFLIELFIEYKRTGKIWHFYNSIKDSVKEKYGNNVSDYSKIKDWGLMGSKGDYDPDGKSTGYYCISKKGVAFLNGNIYIPKYLYQTTTGETFNQSDKTVHITDYINNFSLKEIKF